MLEVYLGQRKNRPLGRPCAMLILSLALLIGCAEGEYVVEGFHAALPSARTRIVVWGEHPGAVNIAMSWLQERGLAIVERARLDQVLKEQMIQLTHTRDDQGEILRIGQIAGASMIVFVELSGSSKIRGEYLGVAGGMGSVGTVYDVTVSIRSINLETSEVVWAGSAKYPRSISHLENAIGNLTKVALERAWCDKNRWHWDSCQKQ